MSDYFSMPAGDFSFVLMFRKGRGAFPAGFLRTGVTERMLAPLPGGLREPCSGHETALPAQVTGAGVSGAECDVHLVKTEEVFLSRSVAGYPLVAIQYIDGKA